MNYRVFIRIKGTPELWGMEVSTNDIESIIPSVKEYMEIFDVDWKIIYMSEIHKNMQFDYTDINLN